MMLSYCYFPVPNQRIQNDRNPMYDPCQSEFSQTGGRLFANYMYEVLHTTQSQQVSVSQGLEFDRPASYISPFGSTSIGRVHWYVGKICCSLLHLTPTHFLGVNISPTMEHISGWHEVHGYVYCNTLRNITDDKKSDWASVTGIADLK